MADHSTDGAERSEVRILAQTASAETVLVAVEGDELPAGGFDPALYQPVRIFDVLHGVLSQPMWLGSALKFLGGYLEEPALGPTEEERVLARVAYLMSIPQEPPR